MEQIIRQKIEEYLAEIISIRHAIHRQPELRYEELKTAKLITETLQSYGYEPITGIAKTGVSALLDSGNPGKTIALRADMGALPIQEISGVPFSSENAGVMHACGHDGHIATLLLAAKVLMEHRRSFNGRIKFIFQPAEELGFGAREMINEGILKNPKVDAIFGYHNIPTLSEGKIYLRTGCIFGGLVTFAITVQGIGGHASAPEKSVDPIYAGSLIIQGLQSIVSRNISPFDPIVISVTQFHAGNADNVIPDKATLRGSIRFVENATFETIKIKIANVAKQIGAGVGAEVAVHFENEVPSTINTAEEVELVKKTATILFGNENVIEMKNNLMVTEDFSFYLQEIPGCFFLVGTGENKPYCHHPAYQFEDNIIPIAAETMIYTALNYLG